MSAHPKCIWLVKELQIVNQTTGGKVDDNQLKCEFVTLVNFGLNLFIRV